MMTRGASGPATPLLLAWSCVAGWSPVLFGVDGVIAVISTRQHTHPRTSCSFGFPFLHCSSSHTSSPILAFGLVISHLGHIRKFFTHGRDVSPFSLRSNGKGQGKCQKRILTLCLTIFTHPALFPSCNSCVHTCELSSLLLARHRSFMGHHHVSTAQHKCSFCQYKCSSPCPQSPQDALRAPNLRPRQ
jgi:hypothetical protein